MDKLRLVAKRCKIHRRDDVGLSLKEMGLKVDTYFKTLSAFENGRSTNINHLIKYLELGDAKQNEKLVSDVIKILADSGV